MKFLSLILAVLGILCFYNFYSVILEVNLTRFSFFDFLYVVFFVILLLILIISLEFLIHYKNSNIKRFTILYSILFSLAVFIIFMYYARQITLLN